jgi:hypothetical protein
MVNLSLYFKEKENQKVKKYAEEAKPLLKNDFLDLEEEDRLRIIFHKAEDLEDENLSNENRKIKDGLLEKIFHKLKKNI